MSIPSRQLVKKVLSGSQSNRLPIILNLGPYAAKLNQLSYQQMTADPTLLANALQNAYRLFRCDGLVIMADPTMEAEACGCQVAWTDDEPVVASYPLTNGRKSENVPDFGNIETRGRVAVALEAARRLNIVIGKEVALFGAITGPITMGYNLCGPRFLEDLDQAPDIADVAFDVTSRASQAIAQIAKKYLEAGMDAIIVADPLLDEVNMRHYARIDAALRAVWNIVDFFDAHSILLTKLPNGSDLDALLAFGARGLALEGDADHNLVAEKAARRNKSFAISLSASLLCAQLSDLEREVLACKNVSACARRAFFACWQVPRSTPPENLHELLRLLRD